MSRQRIGSLAEFGALMEQLPVGAGPATTARREKVWAQVSAQRSMQGQPPIAAMDAGLKYIEELERSLPAGSKPLVMPPLQAAQDVAAEYTQFATQERVENGEMFRLTLLAMRQYLELYALLSGPRGGGVVKPIAVTFYEFEMAVPLLKKWGVRVGDTAASFARIDTTGAGVVKFDDFARWVMRSQMESLASSLMLRNAHSPAPPQKRPSSSGYGGVVPKEKQLNTLALSLGAGSTSPGGGTRAYVSPHRYVSPTKSPIREGPSSLPSTKYDDGRAPRTMKSHKNSTIPVRPKSAKYDLTERLTQVGLQQYARRLQQLGFDDVRQLLALQYAADHRDNCSVRPIRGELATLLDGAQHDARPPRAHDPILSE